MKRLLVAMAALAACGDTTPTVIPQLNLDRPTDMTFACYGGLRLTGGGSADPNQEVVYSAQPMQACDIRSQYSADGAQVAPPGQEDLAGSTVPPVNYYGFILEPSIGTVAISQWAPKPPSQMTGGDVIVLDSDPLTPGENGITVGDDPVAIATDTSGCYVLTANAGSCDMSVLDITSAASLSPPAKVDRFDIKNAAGVAIHAKPAAMVAAPPAGTIGNACPMTATGIVYIAYPGCHLVAAVDAGTATVVGGITYDANGVASILPDGNVTCPDECNGEAATTGTRPVALDLHWDVHSHRRALAIGADNSSTIVVANLDDQPATLDRPVSLLPVTLQDPASTLGVTSVSVTPQIGMGGSAGIVNDDFANNQFQFVYAVATDRSVRVADILNVDKECDTQVDPRLIWTEKDITRLACFPVGDPATPPRRPGARGPGIELPGDAVPMSVMTYHVDTFTGDSRDAGPAKMIGYFAAISSSTGAVYLANIDDDSFADFVDPMNPLGTALPLDIAHQLRDGVADRGLLAVSTDGTDTPVCDDRGPDPDTQSAAGGPRSPDPPVKNVPNAYVAGAKVFELPYLRAQTCTGPDDTRPVSDVEFSATPDVRSLTFPDLEGLKFDENWALTYEGTLSLDSGLAIDGPIVRTGEIVVDGTGMHFDDQMRPFCDAGVEPWDILQLRGCDPANNNADCPDGYTCYVHPQSQIQGLGACMLSDEAERLANACRDFLVSLRRYTIGKSTSGELILLPRKHVLRTTPVDGCVDDNQCQGLANYAVQNPSTANPIDPTIVDTHHWSCQIDRDRAPELDGAGQPMKRCLETCQSDSDCSVGSVCQNGLCFEGVIPPQACVNAPQRYELHGSEAFVVIGSRSGYVHPMIADASGNCVRDPSASPLRIGRIPLRAPACDPTADPRTGRNASGQLEPNPCEETVTHSALEPAYSDLNSCTAAAVSPALVERQADAIKFRNRGMTLRLVDPTYPGDQKCVGDRMANLGKVPLAAAGYQIGFRETSGFAPLSLPIGASLPIKLVRQPRGPGDVMRDVGYGDPIWVVDEGDFLSNSLTQPSTRGKVFRAESQAPAVTNTLE